MPGLLDLIGGLLGGNLLGGQAPSRPAPQALPGYGGAEGNPLMAGLQNFANAGSPMGALGGLITGLSSGQRTDPVGAYQQMANMTYRIMRQQPGVTDAQAQLAAINPVMQKEIISRAFPQYEFKEINGTLVPVEKNTGRIGYAGAYTPPRDITLSPGQVPGQWGPMVGGMPQGGGIPAPGGPIQRAPLAPIPVPGPETPGATSAGGLPPSPTRGAPLGGPSTPGVPGALPVGPAQRGVPPQAPLPPTAGAPGAAGGLNLPLGPPMTIAEEARQREAGGVAGKTGATLPASENELKSAIDLIDALKKHPGKTAAVGPLAGSIPALGLAPGHQADFIRNLEQAQTVIAPLLGGNEKTKVEVTGTDRRQEVPQFDRQLDALKKTLQDKINALHKVAGEPGAPEAPQTEAPVIGTGAAGVATPGQGAPDGGWVNVGKGRVRIMPGQ